MTKVVQMDEQLQDQVLKICPKSKVGTLSDRVPRAWWVKNLLFFLPIKRYKCYHCGRKPYIMEGRKGQNG